MSRLMGVAVCASMLLLCSAVLAQERLAEALRSEIESLQVSGRLDRSGVNVASRRILTDLYERRQFEPAWNRPQQAMELLELIRESAADGLDPADYHLAAVERGVAALTGATPMSPPDRAELDLLLTDALTRLAYHQRFGKVDPYTLDPQWNFRRELADGDPVTALQETIDSPSLRENLETVIPRGWFYRGMRDALARYRAIAANGGWPTVTDGPTLRPGDTDSRIPTMARRLAVTGDLPDGALAAIDDRYGLELEQAVRRFQARHGLDIDGIVGPGTRRAMNVSAAQRVRQLEINLERARWVLDDISDYFILVNIAGFRVYVVRDQEIVWQTRAQVGRPYRKSPVFRDEMKYLVLNPTWTVPYSIATRDLLPQIKQDPAFFETRGFDLLDRNGNRVDPSSVDWAGVTSRDFRYTLVQQPGPANAMGRMKFMFPNQHAVYLHDTPSRYLFDRADRSFSSGCIRIENPIELAEILLGPDGWTQERLEQVIDTEQERTVFLSTPVPVFLLYWTAQANLDGTVSFFPDVYDRDGAVDRALDEPFALQLPVAR